MATAVTTIRRRKPLIKWSWWHPVRVVGVIVAAALVLLWVSAFYDWGHEDGVAKGYDQGVTEGYDTGLQDGYDKGYEAGQGDTASPAYDLGYDDGYYSGSLETCQTLIDLMESRGLIAGGASSLCSEFAAAP
jgi:hypothetical protein